MIGKHIAAGLAVLALLAATPALAKIVKTARPDCEKNAICFYWWPELPALPGWHAEPEANFTAGKNGIYVLVPNGATFQKAGVLIYGNAVLKSTEKGKDLNDFIQGDKDQARKNARNQVEIADAPPLEGADGKTLRSVTYFNTKAKVWERVTFTEEGEYFIVFALRADALEDYQKAQKDYAALVKAYRP